MTTESTRGAALRWLVLAATTCFAALVIALSPAQAHDRLLEADPADGSTVAQEDLTSITLKFSATPLDLGNQMVVKDSAGTVLFEGQPKTEGSNVIADLKGTPEPGELTIRWRVVSSDGHPIEDTLTYTVTGKAKGSDGASPSTNDTHPADKKSEAQAQGEASAKPTVEPVQTPKNAQEKKGSGWMLWLPLAGVAVLAIGAAAFLAVRAKGDDEDDADEGDDSESSAQ